MPDARASISQASSLSGIRALSDMRVCANDPEIAARLVARGQKIVAGRTGKVEPNDLERLKSRLQGLEAAALSEDTSRRPLARGSAGKPQC
jgi:hypothetical protein